MSAQARLDSVCEIVMGQAPDGDAYNLNGQGWPLVAGAGDFGDGFPSVKKHTTQASKLSRKGDIVLSIRASIGQKVLADGEYCLGRGVAGLRPRPQLEARYLWHWLDSMQQQLAAKAKGATFKQVNRQDIGELPIALPPLETQRRIARLLDAADALRAKRRATIALLDSLTSAVFVEMFGDPVTNPKALPVSRLAELGTLDRGVSKHRPRNAPELLGGLYPLIQTGEIANCGGYLSSHTATYSQAGLNQSKLWPAGTLCITIAANIAKTGILMFDACFPDSVVGFSSDPATVEYVRVWLSFLQKSLEDNAPESAQKNINLGLLRQLPVPVPSMAQRQLFAGRVTAVQALQVRQQQSVEALNSLFASLQQRAFNGELNLG